MSCFSTPVGEVLNLAYCFLHVSLLVVAPLHCIAIRQMAHSIMTQKRTISHTLSVKEPPNTSQSNVATRLRYDEISIDDNKSLQNLLHSPKGERILKICHHSATIRARVIASASFDT